MIKLYLYLSLFSDFLLSLYEWRFQFHTVFCNKLRFSIRIGAGGLIGCLWNQTQSKTKIIRYKREELTRSVFYFSFYYLFFFCFLEESCLLYKQLTWSRNASDLPRCWRGSISTAWRMRKQQKKKKNKKSRELYMRALVVDAFPVLFYDVETQVYIYSSSFILISVWGLLGLFLRARSLLLCFFLSELMSYYPFLTASKTLLLNVSWGLLSKILVRLKLFVYRWGKKFILAHQNRCQIWEFFHLSWRFWKKCETAK